MSGVKTFARGGIEPIDHKSMTSHVPIKNAAIPAVAVIPLDQHTGTPALSLVARGDDVKEGMLIARAVGFHSAHIHSPIPGRVSDISERLNPDGKKCQAITIECAGEFDRSGKILNRQAWDTLDGQTLNALLAEMGLVELSGDPRPAHAAFAACKHRPVATLVIDGVEGEPYLTGEHRLMLEKPSEVLEGACIVQKIVGAGRVILAVGENKADAIEVLKEKIEEKALPFTVIAVKTRYPQGHADLLRSVLLGHGHADVRCSVVSSVSTVFAAYEAIVWRKPLTERVITVTGSIVAQPSNLKARIGTTIGELFEDCGGFTGEPGLIVMGGPMSGTAVVDLQTPITKGVAGLIAFSRRETAAYSDGPCIRCGRCYRACPWGLSPSGLVKLIRHQRYQEAEDIGLERCTECGCCAYGCPARISIVKIISAGKQAVASVNKDKR
jgi:electron transport complex protein RnfC